MIDWDVVPKECPKCKRPAKIQEWVNCIGGTWKSVADRKNYFEYKCYCGHKMSTFIVDEQTKAGD